MSAGADVALGRVDALLAGIGPPALWMSDAELARLQAIASDRRRAQFVGARWLARELLARRHGRPAHEWRLTVEDQGPPRVTGAQLALSHSGDWAACAVADVPLGIDVEMPARPRDLHGLAELCCTAAERELLQAGTASFYELWCAKEAWVKRHAGQAAPARLQAIELLPCEAQAADVQVWAAEGVTLALSAPSTLALHWWGAAPPWRSAWQVRDEALRPA